MSFIFLHFFSFLICFTKITIAQGVHCCYVIVDGGIGKESGDSGKNNSKMDPDAIAETYWHMAQQPRNCWTQELDVRPYVENW